MMKFGQIPRNMADILIEPSSTSVECVSEFVKRMQGLVTSAVVECGSVTLLSLVLSIRVMFEILVETTA
jgi:hypothetical protein